MVQTYWERPSLGWLRRPGTLVLASLLVAAALSLLCIAIVVQARHDAFEHSLESANNVALLVERDTVRNIEIYDLSLQAVMEGLRQPELMRLAPQMRQLVLFDRAASAREMGAIVVLDKAGNIVFDSKGVDPRPGNFSSREYFTVHRDAANLGLYISRPYRSHFESNVYSIALSRRLSNPDGSFAGVVVGTLRLSYFRHLFDGMNLGPEGSMALMRDDGTMLMRRPYDESVIGMNLRGTSNFTHFMHAHAGTFSGTATIDGVARWYVFRHVGNLPLLLDVAPATEYIYANWRRRAWIVGSAMGSLSLMIVGLAAMFAGQLKRRLAAEQELWVLARTDGLTGIGNRRAFDEMASAEWRRAQQRARPLSILLIDIDHFKQFNDLYGHPAGDAALTAIAQCITSVIRRPGDSVARYGGEELVVLLPDTEADGAASIAEKIGAAVRQLDIAHASSAHGVLTVSIGIATALVRDSMAFKDLLSAADRALYEAKRRGRDRVVQLADSSLVATAC